MWPFKKKKNMSAPSLTYSEKEVALVERHIGMLFGEIGNVFHEIVSPDLHIDIQVIPPTEGRNYYTLVTTGMGAYRMTVPELLAKERFNRAELAIRLPADWELHSQDEKWFWPIRVLKTIARLPYLNQSWLSFSHSFDFGAPFSEDTKMSAVLLDFSFDDIRPCTLPNGDNVVFYDVIPIYKEEMEHRFEMNPSDFLDIFTPEELHGVLDINRKSHFE